MSGLRGGFSTGACAAAAAKAAALLLRGAASVRVVTIPFPDGARESFAVEAAELLGGNRARAAVRKSAGDDPDVTDKALVVAQLRELEGEAVEFKAGEGVGTVTKPGLSIQPGEPAINPGPRRMIAAALREVSPGGYEVAISIPGGAQLAQRTFNPRLGITGGVSILGTTGRVVPFSHPALREALACALDIAQAAGERSPVLVPGKIGKSAAERHFALRSGQVVEVSNEWGYMLEKTVGRGFEALLLLGHPGKLAKLAMGHWDTHSRSAPSASAFVRGIAVELLGDAPWCETVEGVLEALPPAERRAVAERVAAEVARSASAKLECGLVPAVVLVDMKGEILGTSGDLTRWHSG
ncbi:MAG: cobalt-precorrin-5B (C(1))-methyltransferase CbiD [Candidatus Methylomirabilia bacterium]